MGCLGGQEDKHEESTHFSKDHNTTGDKQMHPLHKMGMCSRKVPCSNAAHVSVKLQTWYQVINGGERNHRQLLIGDALLGVS